jgi:hypothetical protein
MSSVNTSSDPKTDASAASREAPFRPGLPPDVRRLLLGRSLRAFGDGYVAILLPLHLTQLGFGAFAVGAVSTATLMGSALLTLAVGLVAHRVRRRSALLGAALLMALTGLVFLRHGCRAAGGAARCGQCHGRAAQPRIRPGATPVGVASCRELLRLALDHRGWPKGRLRPGAAPEVLEGQATRGVLMRLRQEKSRDAALPRVSWLAQRHLPVATVSLFQSEVILFGMRMAEHYHVVVLVVVTSDRNILGLCVNRFLGRFIADFENYRWIPLSKS